MAEEKKAPSVTLNAIEANIASEHYFTATELVGQTRGPGCQATLKELDLITFCVLVLRNGFTVTGESACVSPENFDAETGRKIARQHALAKMWPLMGYALQEKLASRPTDYRDRVRLEAKELGEKLAALKAFLGTAPADFDGRHLLEMQLASMTEYHNVLNARIGTFGA